MTLKPKKYLKKQNKKIYLSHKLKIVIFIKYVANKIKIMLFLMISK